MTEPWVRTLLRGRWVESLLAMVAVVAVTWPIGSLVSSRPWTEPLVGVLLLLVVVGSLVRMARVPRWLVLLAQALALLSGLSWWAQAQTAGNESALTMLNALLVGGVETIQTYAVPAPATPGLTFVVLAGTALLGLVVEALGVTLRAAALAGVPLLLVSAGTASSSGQPLDPRYFLLGAAAWLVVLARQGRSVLESWDEETATSTTVDRTSVTRGGYRRLGVTARVMGLSALVLAVLVPGALPHLPPTVLLDGRSGDGTPGTVTFTDTLDVAQDLADRSNAPVIRYRTEDPTPPPLRVTATVDYADGTWRPVGPATSGPYLQPEIFTYVQNMTAVQGIETSTESLTVTQNGLGAPQLAVPYPTSEVDLGESSWMWNPITDVVQVDDAPRSYTASYLKVGTLATLPDQVGVPPEALVDSEPVEVTEETEDGWVYRMGADGQLLEVLAPDGRRERILSDGTVEVWEPDGTVRRTVFGYDGLDPLAVDPASEDWVRSLSDELAGELTNQVDIAMEIQRYLRSSVFSYSLTLADPVQGEDGQPLDPVSHFLETKQGYCTQFATAMVMLARAQDIPARLALGFLPGSQGLDGTRTVVAADAHAWPELFISGLGWTRFEPTPGSRSGSAPFYSTGTDPVEVPTAAPEPTVAEPTVDPAMPDPSLGAGSGSDTGWFERNAPALGRAALGVATAWALLSVVPLAARWRRWRLRRATDAAGRIEAEWTVLALDLADLGVDQPRAATPRGLRDHYARELQPDATTLDALTRAVDRLESARYAATTPPVGTMREDVRRVVDWSRRRASRGRRLRAALLPDSGRDQLRTLLPGSAAPAAT